MRSSPKTAMTVARTGSRCLGEYAGVVDGVARVCCGGSKGQQGAARGSEVQTNDHALLPPVDV